MSMDEALDTIVVGGGQAGLAAGYYLKKQGKSFIILDENVRTGNSWRRRWDSLRLFTPCKYNGLPGMPFPGEDFYFPTKDETADYLETYVRKLDLPVRHTVKAHRLERAEQGYRVATSAGAFLAKNVIVATGAYQKPFTPAFASQLDPAIYQIHSSGYCNPQQVPAQSVLVVGAANSGAEIALELARAGRKVWLSGPDVGRIPADRLGRLFGGRLYWLIISRVLSERTPVGRKMKAKVSEHGAPWIRVKPKELEQAGIERAPRVSGVTSGKPVLQDGRGLPAEGVIWATGYRPDYHWIDLPVFEANGFPRSQRGVVAEAPGIYFLGLLFQSALSSALLGGVGEEAEYIARQL